MTQQPRRLRNRARLRKEIGAAAHREYVQALRDTNQLAQTVQVGVNKLIAKAQKAEERREKRSE